MIKRWLSSTPVHLALLVWCFWAIYALFAYRMLGRAAIVALPWVGVTLGALELLVLMRRVVAPHLEGPRVAILLHRAERVVQVCLVLFSLSGVYAYANATLDLSPPRPHATEVREIDGSDVDVGFTAPYWWAAFRSWRQPDGLEHVLLWPKERWNLWGGQPVIVHTRDGFFGPPWVVEIAEDEERRARAIIHATRTAAQAWKDLTQFYYQQARWDDVVATTTEYQGLYPADHEFPGQVVSWLFSARRWKPVVAIGEPLARRWADYETYGRIGYAMTWIGRRPEGVEWLKAAIALKPEEYWAYYALGSVYRDAAQDREAVEMFERVLERRPDFPQIAADLHRLRATLASRPE